MDFLNAVLAFALSMVVFSTIVLLLVEILQSALADRETGLRTMLSAYFGKMFGKVFDSESVNIGVESETQHQDATRKSLKQDFLDVLTRVADPGDATLRKWYARFGTLRAPKSARRISVGEFVRRLARTKVGAELAKRSKAGGDAAAIEAVIHKLVHEFVDHATRARREYLQNARGLSVAVAIILAVVANIDAWRLFNQFLNMPSVAESLLAVDAKVIAEMKAVQVLRSKAYQQVADTTTDSEKATAGQGLNNVRKKVDELTKKGLAIGVGYFPSCTAKSASPVCKRLYAKVSAACLTKAGGKPEAERKTAEENCAAVVTTYVDAFSYETGAFVRWLCIAILTGLLIGIGGPFWFDLYSGLSRWVGVLRGEKGQAGGATAQDNGDGSDGADGAAIDTKALAQSFNKEIEAQNILGVTQ